MVGIAVSAGGSRVAIAAFSTESAGLDGRLPIRFRGDMVFDGSHDRLNSAGGAALSWPRGICFVMPAHDLQTGTV